MSLWCFLLWSFLIQLFIVQYARLFLVLYWWYFPRNIGVQQSLLFLSVSSNNILVIFVCMLWGHKSTRAVSTGCSSKSSPHLVYSKGITQSFTEFWLTWSFILFTCLPSLFVKLGSTSCVKHNHGLCISFQNSPVFKNIMKSPNPRHFKCSVV